MEPAQHKIRVDVDTSYLEDQSDPKERRYVFSYTITIRNEGSVPARLLTRHWIITDSNGKVQEVRGEGVVGEQPYLKPGQGFRYSSGAVLETRDRDGSVAQMALVRIGIAKAPRQDGDSFANDLGVLAFQRPLERVLRGLDAAVVVLQAIDQVMRVLRLEALVEALKRHFESADAPA